MTTDPIAYFPASVYKKCSFLFWRANLREDIKEISVGFRIGYVSWTSEFQWNSFQISVKWFKGRTSFAKSFTFLLYYEWRLSIFFKFGCTLWCRKPVALWSILKHHLDNFKANNVAKISGFFGGSSRFLGLIFILTPLNFWKNSGSACR